MARTIAVRMLHALSAIQPGSDEEEASLFQQSAGRRIHRACPLGGAPMRSAQRDIVRYQTWKFNGHMQQQDRAIERR